MASDLTKASQSATVLQKNMPALYKVVFDHSRATLPGMEANFLWAKSVIRDKPTYVLSHLLAAGGSMKWSIGSRVMAGQMKEIFDRGRKSVEH